MAGMELFEFILFLKQLGFVVAGGAALWGLVISMRDFKCGNKECLIHDWIAMKLFMMHASGVILGGLALFASLLMVPAMAHEGIVILPSSDETFRALMMSMPIFLIALVGTIIVASIKKIDPKNFSRLITPFFAINFAIFFILTSLTAWGDGARENTFFAMHGFHSIFTLGSVLTLDFLFLMSRHSKHLKSHIFPLFNTITKVILVGLLVDFMSVYLILPDFVITTKFLFAQTVIGIIIINGAFLSGPIARRMMDSLKDGDGNLSGRWRHIGNMCGTISVVSWTTITFIDFFKSLSASYTLMALVYASVILLAFTGHTLFEKFEEKFGPINIPDTAGV